MRTISKTITDETHNLEIWGNDDEQWVEIQGDEGTVFIFTSIDEIDDFAKILKEMLTSAQSE